MVKKYYIMPKFASKQYSNSAKSNDFLLRIYPQIVDDFLSRIEIDQECSILDVGTGPGMIPIELAKKTNVQSIYGIDLSPNMIDFANKNAEVMNFAEKIIFKEANVIQLPFNDNSIDYITSSFSIHEWPEPEKSLKELFRVLNPSGKMVIYDMQPNLDKALKKRLKKEAGWLTYKFIVKGVPKSYAKTLDMLESFLNNSDLEFKYSYEERNELAIMIFNNN